MNRIAEKRNELNESNSVCGLNTVTNMESRFPAMWVLWLGREFYRGKYEMIDRSHVWTPDLGNHLGDLATDLATLATKYGISKVLESSRYLY
ncbi:hypothetical protein AVEN_201223-1 [Araneus ventricosus]|uniref:Uncharacterized protein n=1 Tax=Araneus ventricosus TaxID=182803 RepID=A0A4Y2HPH3_ARAVE|nr:hypothetical protein AVEN_201223-1 [Araneus ventricosus]